MRLWIPGLFQFTTSLRRLTQLPVHLVHLSDVSIHNLLTEVDNSIVIFVILSVIVSIHNLLTEVD